MKKFALRQTCAMNGVAIYDWCGYLRKWCGYLRMVWLSTNGVAIYEKGVAISISVSRAPCRSQKMKAEIYQVFFLNFTLPKIRYSFY